jgi:hypothetical protein
MWFAIWDLRDRGGRVRTAAETRSQVWTLEHEQTDQGDGFLNGCSSIVILSLRFVRWTEREKRECAIWQFCHEDAEVDAISWNDLVVLQQPRGHDWDYYIRSLLSSVGMWISLSLDFQVFFEDIYIWWMTISIDAQNNIKWKLDQPSICDDFIIFLTFVQSPQSVEMIECQFDKVDSCKFDERFWWWWSKQNCDGKFLCFSSLFTIIQHSSLRVQFLLQIIEILGDIAFDCSSWIETINIILSREREWFEIETWFHNHHRKNKMIMATKPFFTCTISFISIAFSMLMSVIILSIAICNNSIKNLRNSKGSRLLLGFWVGFVSS